MNEFAPFPERAPETQPLSWGGPPQPPPRPPKLSTRDLLEPGGPERKLFVPAYIEVRELAEQLGVKPFKIVAELLELRLFKHADELIDFPTAAIIGNQHGYAVERLM